MRRLLSLLALLGLSLAAAADESPSNGDDLRVVEIFGPAPPTPPSVVSRDAQGRVTMRAIRLGEPLDLDGRLDDAVYDRVPAVSDFIQQEPFEGQPASEQTEVWVFFDDDTLYVGARCWDSQPERMVANEMRRDHSNIYQNENFTILLDTFYDRRNGYYFQTNPLGALRDQAVSDEGQVINHDWNTVWNTKATLFESGYTLEMAIPFKSLRYKATRDQIWGINFRRMVRWKNETSYLAPIPAAYGNPGVYRFSVAGTLVGVQTPENSRNIELKPYAISTVTTDNNAEVPFRNDLDGDAGFDLKYGLTQSLIADFTYNTDFAQVEEDQQQVNLTRFSLFFPEKREFFLEGQGIFSFGGVRQRGGSGSFRPGLGSRGANSLTPILFFSRRIGLTQEGIDPIRAGGRVTGRAGKYRLGMLEIRTEGIDEAGVDPTNFSVIRVRRDVLGRSDIGVIATHRNTSLTEEATSNLVAGVDANFAFYQNIRFNTYYAVSRTSSDRLGLNDESSYMGRFDFEEDRYGLRLEHLKVGRDFKPELGFLRRENFRRSFAQARFSPRPLRIDAIRRVVLQADFDYITDTEGHPETKILKGTFRLELENGDQASVNVTDNFEFLPEEFEIATDVLLPVAEYDFRDILFSYQFGPQRVVPGVLTYRKGTFFGGDRDEITYNGRIEISPRFSLEPRFSLNFVRLPEGDFIARLVSTRINYSFSPRTFLSSFIQYNSSSDAISSSVRLRWEYEPGSDLFVVYSEGREDLSGMPALANRTFAVKFTKLFRF